MRIFAAILLPAHVEAHLDEYVDALRQSHPELRWVAPSSWHVTLEFLGECGPHEVARQTDRWARRAGRAVSMQLHLAGAGAFPRTWAARVLWTGLAGDVADWRTLAGHGQQPHLTLARTRQRADLAGPVDALTSYEGPSWRVSEIALVESRLPGKAGGHTGKGVQRGPRYLPLEHFALGRPEPLG